MSAFPYLVLQEGREVVGYAYASKWKGRCSYRYSIESTIYIALDCMGRDLGTQLCKASIDVLRTYPVHRILAGLSFLNPSSAALAVKVGFEKIAHFKQVGWKLDQWIDVGHWELILYKAE